MTAPDRMGFGIFMAPFHPVGENPTTALHRDLELIEWLDRLGYDEAWFGEHHSAGFEIIASPEVSSPRRPRAPATSGSGPACPRCPTTIPSCWPTGWCCSTT